MPKPTFDPNRPMSWSQMSSFEYDPEQWYKKYVLGMEPPPTAEMKFGKKFADSIEDGTCKVKELMGYLQKKKEHEFKCTWRQIPLIGYGDAFCDETFKILDEVKTGKREWTQKRADEHGQIDWYNLMNFLINKIRPEEMINTIYWLPTQDKGDFTIDFIHPVKVYPFRTNRTMSQVLKFGARIVQRRKEMVEYCKNHPQVFPSSTCAKNGAGVK